MQEDKKTIWDFFVHNSRFTLIIVATILVFGGSAVFQIPKESNPEVNIPFATVITVFPGAGVEDVEELVTTPIEDRLAGLADVKEITSSSSQGVSSVFVEFDIKADPKEKISDLRDKVDEAKRELPSNAEDPLVRQITAQDDPILTLAVSGPYEVWQLTQFAKELKADIERIANVSSIQILGGQNPEIQVVVDKAKLDSFGLALTQVTQAIQTANSDIPIGSIETAGAEYTVRFAGRLKDAQEVTTTPITSKNNVPIVVKDVATVTDGFSQPRGISRFSVGGSDPLASVTVHIFKSPGGDITKVVDKVNATIEKQLANGLPADLVIEPTLDFAEFVRDDIGNLSKSGIQTIIIVVLILLLFLGWKEAISAGLAIPLTFLITFAVLLNMGDSLNGLSLFSLILALGILVDSTIVINEGISKQIRAGKSPKDAAIAVIHEFQYPLMSGTLTTVFAFVPMLLMGGIMGEYVRAIPVTVTIVLVASLFVALTIITTFNALFYGYSLRKKKKSALTKRWVSFAGVFDSLRNRYQNRLEKFFTQKKSRKKFYIAITAGFVISLALPAIGALKIIMFPPVDIPFMFVNIEKPIGTPLEETSGIVKQVEEELLKDDRIENFFVNVGSLSSAGSFIGSGTNGHVANIQVNLVDDRKEKSYEISEEYQKIFRNFQDADVTIQELGAGPPTGSPVEIVISGEDLQTLELLASTFKNIVEDIPGTTNVQSSVIETNGQFVVHVDRDKASIYGVQTAQLAFTLRNAITGIQATELSSQGDDVDVVVKYALDPRVTTGKTNRVDISTIESLTIATPQGDIPLSTFANIRLENSRASIRHENSERIVRITGNTSQQTTPLAVFDQVRDRMEEMTIPEGYAVKLGGEDEDLQESYQDMFRAMFLAIFLIFALLVLQFKSYKQAWIIILTIPLALIGVFPGLAILGLPISFPGIIGIVALSGIVVNNAIILIDKINRNRKEGQDIDSSILSAGQARLEPILLTTVTTIFGILPVTLSDELWRGLGASIIWGLAFSTILTLFMVPLLYRRFVGGKQKNS